MNIYVELNKIIEYIENNLEEKIDYKELSRKIGVNEYTFQRIFSIICNISISEYIRNRRLSNAGQELYLKDEKVVDIAIKYQYNNATSFSRAFEKFHGIKPSVVRKTPEKLKMYTKLHFNENYQQDLSLEYKIVEKEQMILYGKYKTTTNEQIGTDAPEFYTENREKHGRPPYGMTEYYDKERMHVKAYWILYNEERDKMQQKVIPQSKWLSIRINSQEAEDIQKVTNIFYKDFFLSCKFNFRDLPELEFYHDGITDFLIPIED